MLSITAKKLAELVHGELVGDGQRVLTSVAPLDSATPDCISFLSNVRYIPQLEQSVAGVVFVGEDVRRTSGDYISTSDPYSAFVTALEYFNPVSIANPGVHVTAVIAEDAQIGVGASVGPHCIIESGVSIGAYAVLCGNVFVGRNSMIGERSFIHPQVCICSGSKIGNRVVIQSGAIVGSDGFGFAPEQGKFRKIPQVGIVVIENDVEIGANTTIDRATMGETRIGEGSKIDNLVQIAHNVKIGKHCVIAAQTGISGSTQFGDYCRVGGQSGFVGHIKIGDGVSFAAKSGVSGDVAAGEIISGSPSRPHGLWKRIEASLTRLPELLRRVRRIEEHLDLRPSLKENQRDR